MKILRFALFSVVLVALTWTMALSASFAAERADYWRLRGNVCSTGVTPAFVAAHEAEVAAWTRNDVVVDFRHNPFPGVMREAAAYRHRTQYTELLYSHFPGLVPARMIQTNFWGPASPDHVYAACFQAP